MGNPGLSHGELLMESGKWMPDDSFDASEVAKGMPVEVPEPPEESPPTQGKPG